MKRKNPKYTHGFIDHDGKPRFYLRVPGRKRVPLPGLPWSPEFMEAREKALQGDWTAPEMGSSRTKAGTVNAALVSYYQSSAFRDGLSESSQKMRRAILERFRKEHGEKRIALLHKNALQVILNKLSPAAASNWRKALRGFIDHCQSLDMISTDPLRDLKLVSIKSDGHHPWEPNECRQFEARHALGTRARLAYELLLQVGHARSDVVRMGRQHVRDGKLALKRQKTGVAFEVELMPPLLEAIKAMGKTDHLTFLVTARGEPFTAAGFGNWFREVCNEAGLPKRCTSHGLRKAAATYLADRGATTTQLMAWFGWKTSSEAERYTRGADRKRNAAAAAALVSGTGIGKPENQFAKTALKSLKTKRVKT
ncbi:phage integrase [Bradyrhizobiaceae bacterium SG-6C]|nr:phage integrase [Bradyrhizobiaceae bacterium SG-6C]